MAFLDDVAADAATLFLDPTDGLAETITQYPGGNTAAPAQVVALVERKERTVERGRGKGRESVAHFWLASSTTLLNTDLWLIDSLTYCTESFDNPEGGLIKVKVGEYEGEFTGPPSKAE